MPIVDIVHPFKQSRFIISKNPPSATLKGDFDGIFYAIFGY